MLAVRGPTGETKSRDTMTVTQDPSVGLSSLRAVAE